MKRYKLLGGNNQSRVVQEEVPPPVPGQGEVRIRVGAASLNHRDLLVLDRARDGGLDGRIPLSDGAGWIDACGSDVTEWQVGERVMANFFPDWRGGPYRRAYMGYALGGRGGDGMLAEQVVLPAHALVRVPPSLSLLDAATLPCAGVTAWHALIDRGGIDATSTVLIQGTGGVALFALQIATAVGAKTIVLSSSDEKLASAEALGASGLVNYRRIPDWHRAVLDLTGGEGVSHVLELGGKSTYALSLASLAPAGHVLQVGGLGGFDINADLDRLRELNATASGINVGSAAHLAALAAFFDKRRLSTVIDRVFAFGEATDAYEHLRGGSHFGKVVVAVTADEGSEVVG